MSTHDLIRISNTLAAMERRAAEPSYKDYVEEKKRKKEKPLSKDEWEAKVLHKGKGDESDSHEAEAKKSLGHIDTLDDELDMPVTEDIREVLEAASKGHDVDPNKAEKAMEAFERDLSDRRDMLEEDGRGEVMDDYDAEIRHVRKLLKAIYDGAR